MQLEVGQGTNTGMIRSGNEDNFYSDPDKGLFVVADGMGGHAAGEVASEMAVTIVAELLSELRSLPDEDATRAINEAVRRANAAIYERTLTETEKHGMGTTVSLLGLHDWHYVIGQVGDSRVYLLREGRLVQLTKDHSYVQEQVDAGALTPEQARYHPYSNVITRCVGAGAEVMADGCVHVYGTLRGRAMAGVRGEVSARVFCHDFHAELVSVAGVFRVFETIPPELAGKPVQAWLDGDDLRFGRIGHD